jgi:hypothetical protein
VRQAALAALLLLTAPALAQEDPARAAVGPAPIHPNDLNHSNAQQRIDEIRRSGNPADYGQMNALEALRQQSGRMSDPALAPIPPERREVPARAAPPPPGEWPGYRPGYLPRQ